LPLVHVPHVRLVYRKHGVLHAGQSERSVLYTTILIVSISLYDRCKKINRLGMDPYPYKDMIKEPRQIGVSEDGNLGALSNDVKALMSYVNVLSSGETEAQFVSPLGNKFFMDTGVKCNDQNGASQARFAFVNNIPDDGVLGRGLVAGILQDVTSIDPSALFNAFSQKEDTCQQITMDTRDNQNNAKRESRYVNNSDISKYNACWFPDRKNPVTNRTCEGFTNRQVPKDPIVQVYIAGVGVLAAYMAYRFMKK